ncbi:Peptidoglycan/LPS O-acetylase OafA/YrhL, contains acyltransferase and SGNH-hydrolase domains [Halopseudomonas xinjiangensis]|uniref:Peptidoglycan/LPS O-acetylase OafA/YrhL, contains acyltransferase and SGNH-hydrolase domains n=1 Tax=Halopseudomonas xinjiangensis TaxID=487184 RepID=A0A1H1X0S1_9GAMM|nr:acyltransferase family protein [Halopseudomonas xinjiangensis]SDT02898.1 Peptidoglycan/LPS O-acetylase OafA/YrhL, contains acyltransferase and SGNH-hydrolase domains [Halopseudomonas xinjiangensis]
MKPPVHNPAIAYRPEVDGLRALAVLPVILYHAGFELFSGGFVGVDVFFVISGYLITAIIYREIQDGTFTVARFYERRIRRLYPAVTAVTLVCLPFAWLLLLPSEFKEFLFSVASVQVFASNLYFWQESDYFGSAAELTPLLHTWSLAVEEQFYLVFPFALILFRRLSLRMLLALLALVALASLALAQELVDSHASASFFLLPTRAWEMLAGSLLALGMHESGSNRRWFGNLAALAGVGLIGLAVFLFHAGTPFPGVYALVPVAGTMLIIAYATRETLVGRVLSLRPLVFIGTVSYSAYLIHQPLFAFTRIYTMRSLTLPLVLGMVGLTFVLAYLSWRFIENPFRQRRNIERHALFSTAATLSTFLFVFALAAAFQNHRVLQYEARLESEQERALAMIEESERTPELEKGYCVFEADRLDPATRQRLQNCHAAFGSGLVVIGDSHGENVYHALAQEDDRRFLFSLNQKGCRAGADSQWCAYDSFYRFAIERPHIFDNVIYNQAGFYLLETPRGREMTRARISEDAHTVFKPNSEDVEKTLDYLDSLSEVANVVWLGPRVEPHIMPREYVVNGCASPPEVRENLLQSFENLDRHIDRAVSRRGRIEYVSTVELIDVTDGDNLIDCKNIYFHDGDHWSPAGERKFGRMLEKELQVLRD